MKILALETSCDDTACAIVEDGRRVLANVMRSQVAVHTPFGGVLPEAAARRHLEVVNACVSEALRQAGELRLDDMDAFAATLGPGLIGSLLIGANVAKTLSLVADKPFRGVNHLFAHVASNYLESDLAPPFLCLLVSGGHTQLILVEGHDRMRIIGETLDDAVGEAYDKVARLLELPFPGGPHLDQLARTGNPKAFTLPFAVTENRFDFSFSGLKTATLRAFERAMVALDALPDTERADAVEVLRRDLAASFQRTVVETLFRRTLACAEAFEVRTITVAGGVSANSAIRERFLRLAEERPEFTVVIPKMAYCTDNAAMVAASAYFNPIAEDWRHDVFSRSAPDGHGILRRSQPTAS